MPRSRQLGRAFECRRREPGHDGHRCRGGRRCRPFSGCQCTDACLLVGYAAGGARAPFAMPRSARARITVPTVSQRRSAPSSGTQTPLHIATNADDGWMDTMRWSPSAAACPSGPMASSTPVASPRAARLSRSPIERATSICPPTPAAGGRAGAAASHPRAASSSFEHHQTASAVRTTEYPTLRSLQGVF